MDKKTENHFLNTTENLPQNLNSSPEDSLFITEDKATYTFVFDSEITTVHFDLTRKTLFLQGHKVQSFAIHPHFDQFLSRFKRALSCNNKGKIFLDSWNEVLSRLGNAPHQEIK